MKSKGRILLGSALSIALCASLIVGSTFALFTSEDSVNIAITSGKVEVTSTVDADSLKLHTYDQNENPEAVDGKVEVDAVDGSGVFPITGGSATLDSYTGDLILQNFVPSNGVQFDLSIVNESNIAIRYQLGLTTVGNIALARAIDVDVQEDIDDELTDVKLVKNAFSAESLSVWREFESTSECKLHLTIDLPLEVDDPNLQGVSCTFRFSVMAVQGNAATTDPIENDPDTSSTLIISDTDEMQGFRDLVDSGVTLEGKTVQLSDEVSEIVLNAADWVPIDNFHGSFDGNGKTIRFNVPEFASISLEDDAHSLFGEIHGTVESKSEIKNFSLVNAKIEGDTIGALASVADNVIFSDITITGTVQISGRVAGIVAGSFSGEMTNVEIDVAEGSSVTATEYAGGLVGILKEGSKLTDVYINKLGLDADAKDGCFDGMNINEMPFVQVTGDSCAGGIAGEVGANVSLTHVTFKTHVTLRSESVTKEMGDEQHIGLIGGIVDYKGCKITRCSFAGWVFNEQILGTDVSSTTGMRYINAYGDKLLGWGNVELLEITKSYARRFVASALILVESWK